MGDHAEVTVLQKHPKLRLTGCRLRVVSLLCQLYASQIVLQKASWQGNSNKEWEAAGRKQKGAKVNNTAADGGETSRSRCRPGAG